ncbi:MAG: tRNA pseudouridine(55) synthase TruB [Desulfobacterales bacterium]|nr:tRNA pseudouridine(55) synthase TruB [Desulfobacterales bacterium]
MNKDINGFVVVNKPENITSAGVVNKVKKIFKVKKAGHTGTLDPFAKGVIVICINKATKLARFLLAGKKKYEAIVHLGIDTDTQDFTGTIIKELSFDRITGGEIKAAFKKFEGIVSQKPPAYSALKYKGIPLYKYARAGEYIEKAARTIIIEYIKVKEINLPFVSFEVFCSGGTYIRTLCSDVGALLGCGGHLKYLNRIESSGFSIDEAIDISDLEKIVLSGKELEVLVPMAKGLKDMPKFVADEVLCNKIKYGKKINKIDIPFNDGDKKNNLLKVIDNKQNLLAVLALNNENYSYCCVI